MAEIRMQSRGCLGPDPPTGGDGAARKEEARQKLADRGFYVYSIRSHFDFLSEFTRARRDRTIRQNDFVIFNQQFNTLIKACLPILKALDLLAERAEQTRTEPSTYIKSYVLL